jgi:hypothetical protein
MALQEPFGHLQHKLWPQKKAEHQTARVENRPDPSVCRWNATHCWKALKESYKFSLDLIPIKGMSKEL